MNAPGRSSGRPNVGSSSSRASRPRDSPTRTWPAKPGSCDRSSVGWVPMRRDSWRIERDFVPLSLEEAQTLRRAIIDAGYGQAMASTVVGWLLDKSIDGVDRTGNGERTRYRKVLASLPEGPRKPGERPIMYLM